MRRSTLYRLAAALILMQLMSLTATAWAMPALLVTKSDTPARLTSSTVVVMRRDATNVVSFMGDATASGSPVALVIPVPAGVTTDEFRAPPRAALERIDVLTAPRFVEYWEQDPCPVAPPPREAMRIARNTRPIPRLQHAPLPAPKRRFPAAFDSAGYALSGTGDASATRAWLTEHGYRLQDAARQALEEVASAQTRFIVAELRGKPPRGAEAKRTRLPPLRYHFESPVLALPLGLGAHGSSTPENVTLVILGPERYAAIGVPNVAVPTNLELLGSGEQFSTAHQRVLEALVEQHPTAVFTEYAWRASECSPCPEEKLDTPELAVLGLDVLLGIDPNPETRELILHPIAVVGEATRGAQPPQLIERLRDAAQSCWLETTRAHRGVASGVVNATLAIEGKRLDFTGFESVGGGVPATLRGCILGRVQRASLTLPKRKLELTATLTFTNPLSASAKPLDLRATVATRFSMRGAHTTTGMTFEPGSPIAGGRERGDPGQTAHSWHTNAFQSRYFLRHGWKGDIDCERPVRGRFGQPTDGSTWPFARAVTWAPLQDDTPSLSELVQGAVRAGTLVPSTSASAEVAGAEQRSDESKLWPTSPRALPTRERSFPPPEASPLSLGKSAGILATCLLILFVAVGRLIRDALRGSTP